MIISKDLNKEKDLNRELFLIDNQLREAQDDHTLEMPKDLKDAIRHLRKAIDRELNGISDSNGK